MKLNTLQELYLNELRDLYHAEQQLIKALPKMATAVASPELKEAILTHFKQTKGHVERLETVFRLIGEKPKTKICHGMQGLIEEGLEILAAEGERSVLDAAIIVEAQKIEHYEIASYGSARTFAELIGQDEAAGILQETLDEEFHTNELLNSLALEIVNPEALLETELAETAH